VKPPESPARTRSTPRAPGPEPLPATDGLHDLLTLGTPREVLARIVPEDALGLRGRIGRRLEADALLLDAERVLLRAQGLCALRAAAWRGEPELGRWLDERVEEALAAVLAEDGAGEREALEPFVASLASDPRALSAACARFNRLPFDQREAFFALVLDAAGPDALARERKLSLSELARRARAALELFRPARSVP
jgi:hypothetical protein